jgi:hypothetical protein
MLRATCSISISGAGTSVQLSTAIIALRFVMD